MTVACAEPCGLEARMKITPYYQHTRLLSFRVLVSLRCQVYSASGEEPTLLSNQLHSEPQWRSLGT